MEKQTDLWHGERGREGEMYGKSNTEIYITVCKIGTPRPRSRAAWAQEGREELHHVQGQEGWL